MQYNKNQGRTTSTENTVANKNKLSVMAVAMGRERQSGGAVRISARSHLAIAPSTISRVASQ